MNKAILKKLCVVAFAFALPVFYMPLTCADDNPPQMDEVIDMVVGDIETVQANNLTRVSVTNPEIADISDAKGDKVSLLGKKAGKTILFLWDSAGKRNVTVRVVNEDLNSVKNRLQKILQEANISGVTLEANMDEGKVVISGALPKEDKDRMNNILSPYSDTVLILVKQEKNEQLIQVDMEVVEISTTLEKNLGIIWGSQSSSSGTTGGTTGTTSGSSTSATSGNINLNYNESLPVSDGHIGDFFKIGNFRRTNPLEATVNAMIQDGKARLISKPRLVAVSGKQASFLVGGEIPINSTTTNTTGSTLTQNTSYSQYGVNMMVTPTVREGKIDVLLNVDIRDIDASNSSNGNVAFITRTASTDLLMDNKQTIVLAGLIKYSDSQQVTQVPFFSKIPVLGLLFRNRSTPSPDSNTEMVIILTPTVITDKKFAQNQLAMPTPAERDSWNEINAKYDHEPLNTAWPAVNKITAGDSSAVLPVMTAYARMVQAKISRAVTYPPAAMGNDWAGTVKLKLHILKDGSLDSEEIMESSGNDALDQQAVQAARTAAPFDPFADGMDQEGIIFTIPIVYNKLISQNQAPADKVIASY